MTNTPTDREARPGNSITRALSMFDDKPDSSGVSVKLGDLRALLARVEELEEQVRDTLKISNLKREQGRLQALDEAISKLMARAANKERLGRSEAWAKGYLRSAKVIQALKDSPHD